MRIIRQFCAVTGLTMALAFSAFAGDMLTPGVNAPGEISTPGATANTVTEMALGFLLNVSSLL